MITEEQLREALKQGEAVFKEGDYMLVTVNPKDLELFVKDIFHRQPLTNDLLRDDKSFTFQGYPLVARDYIEEGKVKIQILRESVNVN